MPISILHTEKNTHCSYSLGFVMWVNIWKKIPKSQFVKVVRLPRLPFPNRFVPGIVLAILDTTDALPTIRFKWQSLLKISIVLSTQNTQN